MGRQRATAIIATAILVAAAAVVWFATSMAPSAAASGLTRFDSCHQLRAWYAGRSPRIDRPAAITSVQEARVDEADLATTDGTIAVTVAGGRLRTYDVTGTVPVRLGTLELPGVLVSEMLRVGDRAILIENRARPLQTMASDLPRSGVGPRQVRAGSTVATVDLTSPSSPRVVDEQTVDGTVLSATQSAGTVRLILRADLLGNRLGKSAQPLALPMLRPARGAPRLLVPCGEVWRPTNPSGVGMVAVVSIDPRRPTDLRATAIATNGSLAYATDHNLYVATPEEDRRGRDVTTQVHAFSTTGRATTYLGSGEIEGTVTDRWAFDEYAGRLRVVSTRSAPGVVGDTLVSVLERSGDRLQVVGSVGGLGPNERVKAVGWFGDRAVVVTFGETDPFHTLDLSDPADPRVSGSLTTPGYSAYLHPLGAGLVLGIGNASDLASSAAQVSTFDVSDPADPAPVATMSLGPGSYSPVGTDPRTFAYLPHDRLAFVPLAGARHGGTVLVVRVGADGELSRVTVLGLTGPAQSARVLPLDATRVALVDGGEVTRLIDGGGL